MPQAARKISHPFVSCRKFAKERPYSLEDIKRCSHPSTDHYCSDFISPAGPSKSVFRNTTCTTQVSNLSQAVLSLCSVRVCGLRYAYSKQHKGLERAVQELCSGSFLHLGGISQGHYSTSSPPYVYISLSIHMYLSQFIALSVLYYTERSSERSGTETLQRGQYWIPTAKSSAAAPGLSFVGKLKEIKKEMPLNKNSKTK